MTETHKTKRSDRFSNSSALLAEKDGFVRGFTQKMLTYALGRSVGATDRETVDGIVQQLERNEYRIQSLLAGAISLCARACRTPPVAAP